MNDPEREAWLDQAFQAPPVNVSAPPDLTERVLQRLTAERRWRRAALATSALTGALLAAGLLLALLPAEAAATAFHTFEEGLLSPQAPARIFTLSVLLTALASLLTLREYRS